MHEIPYCFIFYLIAETPLWLLMHVAPIKNEKDNVVLFLLTFRDITALRQPLDDEENGKGKETRLNTCT